MAGSVTLWQLAQAPHLNLLPLGEDVGPPHPAPPARLAARTLFQFPREGERPEERAIRESPLHHTSFPQLGDFGGVVTEDVGEDFFGVLA